MIAQVLEILAAIPADQVNIPKAEINGVQFQNLFSVVLGIAGIVAVIVVIIGGIRYSISQGNSGELQKAKDIIVYALVGLFFVMFGFVIIQFVTGRVF